MVNEKESPEEKGIWAEKPEPRNYSEFAGGDWYTAEEMDAFHEKLKAYYTEEEIRRIEISIFDEEAEVVFEASGTVTRRTAHKFMESVGYAFIPPEPIPRFMPPVPVRAMGKISCEHDRDCTVYPDKCSKCGNNMAKSYFKPKEESS